MVTNVLFLRDLTYFTHAALESDNVGMCGELYLSGAITDA